MIGGAIGQFMPARRKTIGHVRRGGTPNYLGEFMMGKEFTSKPKRGMRRPGDLYEDIFRI